MEAILQNIWNSFINFFTTIWNFFSSIIDIITTVSWFIISVFWFVFFALKTLVVWIFKLFNYIVGGEAFYHVGRVFVYLSNYIWPVWVLFLASMMTIIIIWILFTFMMKILKGHTGYKAVNDKEKYYDIRDNLKKK